MAKKLLVRRKGYHRKGFVIRRGGKLIRIPPTYVKPATYKIKDRGAPGRGKKVIKVRKGLLKAVGYSTKLSASARRTALRRAVAKYGAARVWRMLHAQVILRKRTQPKARRIFMRDRAYIRRVYHPDIARYARARWMHMSPTARAKAMPGGKI